MTMRPGFFGKLPSQGDFVVRGWSAQGHRAIERWLEQVLEAAARDGSDMAAQIEHAHFAAVSLRAGLVAEAGFEIVVMPSMDRVGRVYPLVAGVERQERQDSDGMEWPRIQYAKMLIGRLIKCIQERVSPDALLAEVERLGDPRTYAETFPSLADDGTLPPLRSGTNCLRFPGPEAAMRPYDQAVCAGHQGACELLAVEFEFTAEVRAFMMARRDASPELMAGLYGGDWHRRGWFEVARPPEIATREVDLDATQEVDLEATLPYPDRAIDAGTRLAQTGGAGEKPE